MGTSGSPGSDGYTVLTVAIRAVQEVVAAKAHYRAEKAVVVTSGEFVLLFCYLWMTMLPPPIGAAGPLSHTTCSPAESSIMWTGPL